MRIRTMVVCLVVATFAFIVSAGCGKGVETGNPVPSLQDLVGSRITVVPATGGDTYAVTFTDENSASVERVEDTTTLETVDVTIETVDGDTFSISALFESGIEVEAILDLDSDGNITSVILFIDATEVDATYSIDNSDSGVANTTGISPEEAIDYLLGRICIRIYNCEYPIEFYDCRVALWNSYEITDEFGYDGVEKSLTMIEVVDLAEAGAYSANESSVNRCERDIDLLTCEQVATGMSMLDPDNYNNVENFIPEGFDSCQGVLE